MIISHPLDLPQRCWLISSFWPVVILCISLTMMSKDGLSSNIQEDLLQFDVTEDKDNFYYDNYVVPAKQLLRWLITEIRKKTATDYFPTDSTDETLLNNPWFFADEDQETPSPLTIYRTITAVLFIATSVGVIIPASVCNALCSVEIGLKATPVVFLGIAFAGPCFLGYLAAVAFESWWNKGQQEKTEPEP